MAEPAVRRMTLEEFLRWDDGTDTRYELINGVAVAMAPPARAHGMLCARLEGMIDASLRAQRPCAAQSEAGIAIRDRSDSFYVVDIAVSCREYRRGEQIVEDPILIVEILSPGTERHVRRIKLPAYRQIDSVQEILLIDPDSHYAELHRRERNGWVVELLRGPEARLVLASVGMQMPMAELYEGIAVEAESEG